MPAAEACHRVVEIVVGAVDWKVNRVVEIVVGASIEGQPKPKSKKSDPRCDDLLPLQT